MSRQSSFQAGEQQIISMYSSRFVSKIIYSIRITASIEAAQRRRLFFDVFYSFFNLFPQTMCASKLKSVGSNPPVPTPKGERIMRARGYCGRCGGITGTGGSTPFISRSHSVAFRMRRANYQNTHHCIPTTKCMYMRLPPVQTWDAQIEDAPFVY